MQGLVEFGPEVEQLEQAHVVCTCCGPTQMWDSEAALGHLTGKHHFRRHHEAVVASAQGRGLEEKDYPRKFVLLSNAQDLGTFRRLMREWLEENLKEAEEQWRAEQWAQQQARSRRFFIFFDDVS